MSFTREVTGVAAGYVTIPLVTMVGTVIATRLVGPAAILARPEASEPAGRWLAFGAALALAAALLAGVTCGLVARTRRAAALLAGIVLTMGIVLALPVVRSERSGAARADLAVEVDAGPVDHAASFRAALAARPPARWLIWQPVLSAPLVLLGARLAGVRLRSRRRGTGGATVRAPH